MMNGWASGKIGSTEKVSRARRGSSGTVATKSSDDKFLDKKFSKSVQAETKSRLVIVDGEVKIVGN